MNAVFSSLLDKMIQKNRWPHTEDPNSSKPLLLGLIRLIASKNSGKELYVQMANANDLHGLIDVTWSRISKA